MLGRQQLMSALVRELTKPSPAHRSVVGARYMGKSVVLAELARRMREEGSPYAAVIEWDLGHGTPRSDETFLQLLSQKIAAGLLQVGERDYGEHLDKVEDDFYGELANILEMLATDEKRILMLWDGFDKALGAGTLTRNLWDNLRELCLKPSLRLVTASRRPLSELIRDEKSVTSDFWNIFGDVVRVGPFNDTDLTAILDKMPDHTCEAGARKELENWSGGNPPLLLSLLNALMLDRPSGSLTPEDVNRAAATISSQTAPYLAAQWSDCPSNAQDLRQALVPSTDSPIGNTASTDRDALFEKGFAVAAGNKIKPACRLLDEYLRGSGQGTGSLARLFGDEAAYQSNIAEVLKRRLAQVSRFNSRLYLYVEMAIGLLDSDPEGALNNLTSIEERALDDIWSRESDAGNIPRETIQYWTQGPRCSNKTIDGMMRANDFSIPTDRWRQLSILQLLTGSSNGFDPRARSVTKDTYVLVNAIHSMRNRNQHADGQDIHHGVAAAALMICVELLACLDRERKSQMG
jgi:hypothetical protein